MSDPVLILEARFYPDLADAMVEGAVAVLRARKQRYVRLSVPGSFELPAAAAWAAASGKYRGIIALGCVIRGKTTHYEHICAECTRGLGEVALRLPLGFGVLTVENERQAWERADPKRGDKGGAAALVCLEMIRLQRLLVRQK